jgi:UDP-glucose 4-epimerase
MPTSRFVLFGSSGFLGRSLGKYLENHGRTVLRLSRSGHDALPIDLGRPDDYIGLLRAADVAVLLVGATSSATTGNTEANELIVNVAPYESFLSAIRSLPLRQIIFVSSGGAVYGQQADCDRIPETAPLLPTTPYGWGKREVERRMQDLVRQSQMPVTILRPANPVGFGQLGSGVGLVAAAVDAAFVGRAIKIWGDGSVVRDYFDVEDFCRAVLLAADHTPPSGTSINLGSGTGRSQIQIIERVEAITGRRVAVQHLPARENEITRNVLAIHRAAELLTWTPTIRFEQTLARLVSKDGGGG